MGPADGIEHFNAAAARETQERTGGLGGLAMTKERFVGIASAAGVFGDVPGGAAAETALENAARSLLQELERAGISVEHIAQNAGTVADIANMTDEEAAFQARLAAADAPGGGYHHELF